MGRQSHLARLALGRSPYGPPLQDENGDLLIGPHTHDNDAPGYVQQFDQKGHPVSKESETQNRKLRRAQNEVLKLAGVVKSKGEEASTDQWHSLSHDERRDLVRDENKVGGLFLRPFNNLILDFSTSWIRAFRNRLVTYDAYLGSSLSSTLRSEVRSLGWRETTFSGLPLSMLVALSRRRRTYLYSWDPYRISLYSPRSKYRQITGSWLQKRFVHGWELLWFALEWPYSVWASLQTLHILPSTFLLKPQTLMSVVTVLFVDESPKLPSSLDPKELAAFCFTCIVHPFVLAYLLDQLRESLQSGIHAILRHSVPTPNEPDITSGSHRITEAQLWHRDEEYLRACVPGFGADVDAKSRYYGPKSFSECLRMAFPGLSKAMHMITGYPPPVRPHLTPDTEEALKQLCDLRYGALWRENRQFTEAQRLPDSIVRRRAVEEALARTGIDPILDSISIDDWSSRWISDRFSEATTATPDPRDLFPAARGIEDLLTSDPLFLEMPSSMNELAVEGDNTPADAISGTTRQPEASINSLEAISSPVLAGTQEALPAMPLPPLPGSVSDAENPTLSPTPTPGISRAHSLEHAPMRRVRRPTETRIDTNSDIFDFTSRPFESSSLLEDAVEEPDDPTHHRVTMLSNYPAEVFTLHASALLTSAIMLPFDMYYHRTLAGIFLGSPRITNPRGMLKGLLPTHPWLGNNAKWYKGEFLVFKNLNLTFGLQAVISSLVWQGAKLFTLFMSSNYGWGKV